MRRLYYTADIDRDVNVQVPGRVAAGSLDRGSGDAPRFSSSDRGLAAILDLLDGVGIRGTLFFEGRTAEVIDCACAAGHSIGVHGYDHEDLTALCQTDLEDVLSRSSAAVTDRVSRPTCFRAPYMTADAQVREAVRRIAGIRRDSSVYTAVGEPSVPRMEDDMVEFPVNKARDADGKTIAAYLWPMHEGRRGPEDYIAMAASAEGDVVIADHSWHMVETRDGGVMSREDAERASDDVRRVIEGILDLGFRPGVIRWSRRSSFWTAPGSGPGSRRTIGPRGAAGSRWTGRRPRRASCRTSMRWRRPCASAGSIQPSARTRSWAPSRGSPLAKAQDGRSSTRRAAAGSRGWV